MRPVNLIPPEERRGERAPMRTGPLAYVVVAVLAIGLVAVTLTVVASNQVSDRKAEKASLESQVAEAQAEAQQVQSFADFASVQQTRETTVSTLAQSRFDWERVLRELAIVIPDDVWITNLNATVSADAAAAQGSGSGASTSSSASAVSDTISGPSLEIQGCAGGHEAVARFLAVVHDIDGVTRATVMSSERPDQTSAGAAATSGSASSGDSQECSSRNFVSRFDMAVAFDAVQLGATSDSSTAPPAESTTPTGTSTTPTDTSGSDQGQVADANQQLQQQKDGGAENAEGPRRSEYLHTRRGVGTVRRNELTIGLSLAALGAIVAFWLLVLAPKRQEATALKADVDQLHSQLAEAQQSVAAGQQAQRSFPGDYRRLVVLGKAVPADGDQASLLVQLQHLADESGVSFQSIDLSDVTTSAAASSTPPPPTSSGSDGSSTPASSTTTSSSSSTSDSSASTTSSTTPTAEAAPVATEASAAALPIGASIGPAGLPLMPYDLTFTGNYFQIADFMKKLNGLVHLKTRGAIDVTGRLVTVDAFTLAPVQSEGQGLTPVPTLTADLSVTTYLAPADLGLTGGATPTGPAPATATPASTTGTASGETTASPPPTSTPTSTAAPTSSP